jgi:hypothetical protein
MRKLQLARDGFRRGCAAGLVLLAGFLTSGCYRYVPVDLASVRPAEDVRMRVTETAAARVVREFGTYMTELEGQIDRASSDSVALTVPVGRDYRGVSLEGGHQVLFFGTTEVVGLRRREFSRGRTALVSAGTLVAFGLLIAAVAQMDDPNANNDEPPPPPPPGGAVIFRLRIP